MAYIAWMAFAQIINNNKERKHAIATNGNKDIDSFPLQNGPISLF